MSDVVLTGVSKSYGAKQVLREVDLTIPTGDLAVLLGPSGCGKTTLLRVLAGHLHPDAGEVRVGGRLVAAPGTHVPPERRGIAIVPQDGALFPHLDVGGNVGFGLTGSKGAKRARVAHMLDLVGLPGHEGAHPSQLSGGQQQRVALARALAPEPSLVLLDEPFSALDAALRASVRADVRRALHDAGATALMVTHDQEEALSMADSVAVMEQGEVVMHAGPEQLYAAPATLEVARFVGDLVELPVRDGRTVLGPLPSDVTAPSGPAIATVRPEHLRIGPVGSGVPGTVGDVRYFGHDSLVEIVLDAGSSLAVRTLTPPVTGARVGISLDGPLRVFPSEA